MILRFMSAYLPRIPLLKSIDSRLLVVSFFIILSFFSGRFLSADELNLILRFCEAYYNELTSIRLADYVKTDFIRRVSRVIDRQAKVIIEYGCCLLKADPMFPLINSVLGGIPGDSLLALAHGSCFSFQEIKS